VSFFIFLSSYATRAEALTMDGVWRPAPEPHMNKTCGGKRSSDGGSKSLQIAIIETALHETDVAHAMEPPGAHQRTRISGGLAVAFKPALSVRGGREKAPETGTFY
jgi:hypothetical protein